MHGINYKIYKLLREKLCGYKEKPPITGKILIDLFVSRNESIRVCTMHKNLCRWLKTA